MNIFLEITRKFNSGTLRAIISGGQAVVLHRLAIMSKDGDWILREDEDSLKHVLSVLSGYGAHYRFGAPLDVRWMRWGWSSHFEFRKDGLRVRTDFVTQPPRISAHELAGIWKQQENRDPPFVSARELAEMKKTNREKDYAVIGELARLLPEPSENLLVSRSARDLITLARTHPELVKKLAKKRPLLNEIFSGREKLETALDAERRMLIHANEKRLEAYMQAAQTWASVWPEVARQVSGCSLSEAHEIVVSRAGGVLPFQVQGIAI